VGEGEGEGHGQKGKRERNGKEKEKEKEKGKGKGKGKEEKGKRKKERVAWCQEISFQEVKYHITTLSQPDRVGGSRWRTIHQRGAAPAHIMSWRGFYSLSDASMDTRMLLWGAFSMRICARVSRIVSGGGHSAYTLCSPSVLCWLAVSLIEKRSIERCLDREQFAACDGGVESIAVYPPFGHLLPL